MTTMEELAAKLNGREYLSEITKAEEADAKASDLLVIFGASDDLIEFRGVFSDETGCYTGGKIRFDRHGVIEEWETLDKDSEDDVRRYFKRKASSEEIEATWDHEGYSWHIAAIDISSATFDILEDGEKYCRGIVIDLTALPA